MLFFISVLVIALSYIIPNGKTGPQLSLELEVPPSSAQPSPASDSGGISGTSAPDTTKPPSGPQPGQLDPSVDSAVSSARKALGAASDAREKGAEASRIATGEEAAGRVAAESALTAAKKACGKKADPKRYFCGLLKSDKTKRYEGEIARKDSGEIVPDGPGRLEDTVSHNTFVGTFESRENRGHGIVSSLRAAADQKSPQDECIGAWTNLGPGPYAVCNWQVGIGAPALYEVSGQFEAGVPNGGAVATTSAYGTLTGDFSGGLPMGGEFITPGGSALRYARIGGDTFGVVTLTKNGVPAGHYEGQLEPDLHLESGFPARPGGVGAFYAADGTLVAQGRWKEGKLVGALGSTGTQAANGFQPVQLPKPILLDPRLRKVVALADNAKAEADRASVSASDASREAEKAAKTADEFAVEAEAAGAKARTAAEKACAKKKAPANYYCGEWPGGGTYSGQIRAGHYSGFGVYKREGWVVEGKFEKTNAFVLGCQTKPKVAVLCGTWDKKLSGIRKSEYANGLIFRGFLSNGNFGPLGVWDGSRVEKNTAYIIKGEFKDGKESGYFTTEYADHSIVSGKLEGDDFSGYVLAVSPGNYRAFVSVTKDPVGEIVYPDGGVFRGQLHITDDYKPSRSGLGVLYNAAGEIAKQGKWTEDLLTEEFGSH